MSDLSDIKRKLLARKRWQPPSEFLSTGSTLLNLACSGRIDGGFPKGLYSLIVGDSSSGKSFLCCTCLAEAAQDPKFADYRFIYDNAENGAFALIEKNFGSKVFLRLEPPRWDESADPAFSETLEEFYYHIDDAFQAGKPFIYILDSMDVLEAKEDQDKFQERKQAHRQGKEATGSYGMAKARANSIGIRGLIAKLRKSKSILIIVCQTRKYVGYGHKEKTRSGGDALRFYARLEFWSSVKKKLTRSVRGKDRDIGMIARLKFEKNHITGLERDVDMTIYSSYGIDDIGSCIDYLLEEKYWSKNAQTIHAADFAFKGTKEKLIAWIEENHKEPELRELVGKLWQGIEQECALKRKNKYE